MHRAPLCMMSGCDTEALAARETLLPSKLLQSILFEKENPLDTQPDLQDLGGNAVILWEALSHSFTALLLLGLVHAHSRLVYVLCATRFHFRHKAQGFESVLTFKKLNVKVKC